MTRPRGRNTDLLFRTSVEDKSGRRSDARQGKVLVPISLRPQLLVHWKSTDMSRPGEESDAMLLLLICQYNHDEGRSLNP